MVLTVQTMKFLIVKPSPLRALIPLGPKYSPQDPLALPSLMQEHYYYYYYYYYQQQLTVLSTYPIMFPVYYYINLLMNDLLMVS